MQKEEPKIRTFHHSRKGIIHAEVISSDDVWMKLKIYNEVKGLSLNKKWEAGEILDVRKSFVKEVKSEVQKNLLDISIEALEASKPTHAHYPEPVERHEKALSGLKKMKTRLKEDYITVEEFLENGGVLTPNREIFSIDKIDNRNNAYRYLGDYSHTDNETNCLILTNASYKSFPMTPAISYVKIQTIPLYV